jgi:curli biogenesis system outer membrane secretion channel CsgG
MERLKKLLLHKTAAALLMPALLLAVLSGTALAEKKRVAVLNFDYGTIRDRWWPGDWDIGKGISDMLVTELVKEGTFSVIERKQLEAVLGEQKLGLSGVVDTQTATQIGKVLGVDAVIVGSITRFSIETKTIGTGGVGRIFGYPDVGVSVTTASVAIDARLIDTTTAEVVAVAEGKSEKKRSGVEITVESLSGTAFGSRGFEESILGEATRQATADLVKKLSPEAVVDAVVAYAEEGIVVMDAGLKQGVRIGQTLYVMKVKKEIKSPRTGEVIKKIMETIAVLEVTEADDISATAIVKKGDIDDIKVGDTVSSKEPKGGDGQ